MKRVVSLIISLAVFVSFTIMPMDISAAEENNLKTNMPIKIEMGSYPQTEIVGEASQCGTYNRDWGEADDYEVNSTLYNKLKTANFDKNGDTVIDGKKYRRLKKSDNSVFVHIESSLPSNYFYYWSDSTTYHYFRYEPLVWQVMYINGDDAFLIADKGIDDVQYSTEKTEVSWKNSSMRKWLNGTFLNMAFTESERNGIVSTDTGSKVMDKVYLLSVSEAKGEGLLSGYFGDNNYNKRMCKSTTYAKAMGTRGAGTYCTWLLRISDSKTQSAAVNSSGGIYEDYSLTHSQGAVRPVLHININNTDIYKIKNYVEFKPSDISLTGGTCTFNGSEQKPQVNIPNQLIDARYSFVMKEGVNYTLAYSDNLNAGTGKITLTGKGIFSGTKVISFTIKKFKFGDTDECKSLVTVNNVAYDGTTTTKPYYEIKGFKEGVDYTVTINRNSRIPGTSGWIKFTGIGQNCEGSLTKYFLVVKADINNLPMSLSETEFTYDGNEKCPDINCSSNIDYYVEYDNNVKAGTGKAIVTGSNYYTGTRTFTFKIKAADITKKTAKFSYTSAVYSGSYKKPTVTISGLKNGTDYTVAYSNNKYCGKAAVKITGKGNYTGTITKYFKIAPAKASLSKVTAGSKKITVAIKSQSATKVSGYEIYYKKSGSSAKTVTTTSTSKTLSKLTKGKKYTVKVRAYKIIDGKKVYGAYSTSKTVTVK